MVFVYKLGVVVLLHSERETSNWWEGVGLCALYIRYSVSILRSPSRRKERHSHRSELTIR